MLMNSIFSESKGEGARRKEKEKGATDGAPNWPLDVGGKDEKSPGMNRALLLPSSGRAGGEKTGGKRGEGKKKPRLPALRRTAWKGRKTQGKKKKKSPVQGFPLLHGKRGGGKKKKERKEKRGGRVPRRTPPTTPLRRRGGGEQWREKKKVVFLLVGGRG